MDNMHIFEVLIFSLSLAILFSLAAFFSGVETALITLSRAKTKQLINSNPKKAKHLSIWLDSPNDVLSTLLIGINVVAVASSTLSAFTAGALARHFGLNEALLSLSSGIFVGLVIIVFGEVIPKIYAIHNAEWLVLKTITPLYFINLIVKPFSLIFTKIGVALIRLLGGKADKNAPQATREEIRFMVKLGSEEGILKGEEGAMLKNIFKFSEKTAKDAMLPIEKTFCVNSEDSINHIIKGTAEEGHTRMPVYKGDRSNIIGIIHGKDLITIWLNKKLFVLADLMRPPYFINEGIKISDLLTEFKKGKIHMALVKNTEGNITGMITLEDVLEEIVGDINNEFDSKTEIQNPS